MRPGHVETTTRTTTNRQPEAQDNNEDKDEGEEMTSMTTAAHRSALSLFLA